MNLFIPPLHILFPVVSRWSPFPSVSVALSLSLLLCVCVYVSSCAYGGGTKLLNSCPSHFLLPVFVRARQSQPEGGERKTVIALHLGVSIFFPPLDPLTPSCVHGNWSGMLCFFSSPLSPHPRPFSLSHLKYFFLSPLFPLSLCPFVDGGVPCMPPTHAQQS